MTAYCLLIRPAANRVFGGDAAALLMSELTVLDGFVLGSRVHELRRQLMAGVEYVAFDTDGPLDDLGKVVVASLSSAYALFELVGGLLQPVEARPFDRFDDDLITTQRYAGKTNEALTRLLVNLALAAAGGLGHHGHRGLRVLDPLCGRGTTLNQALLVGADALGIDADAKDTSAYTTFLTTWLQDKRIKHQVDPTAGRKRFRVSIGRKGASSAGERQVVDVVTADTTDAPALFGRGSVDAIATDLPYGVQHGARTSGRTLSRRPDDLVVDALPAWRAALRPGGGVALAWNTRVLPRVDLLEHLADAGFEVPDLGDDAAFVHRVDRTITRDIVIARRPPSGVPAVARDGPKGLLAQIPEEPILGR